MLRIHWSPPAGFTGRHGPDCAHWSLGQAWDRAQELIRAAQAGNDPRPSATPASAHTVESVFREYMGKPSRKQELRARTVEEYERIWRVFLSAPVGSTPLDKIDRARVKEVIGEAHAKLVAGGNRGLQATKALGLLRSVYKYAAHQGYVDRDPTLGVDNPTPHNNPKGKQYRPPTDAELRLIWTAAPQHMSRQVWRVVHLLILLGRRVSEITNATKDDLLDDGSILRVRAETEGNKSTEEQLVPLPSLAAQIVAEAAKDSGNSPFLFQADRVAPTAMDSKTPSHAFREMRRKLGIADDNVRLHDMRGLVNDQLSKLGVPMEYRSHALGQLGDVRRPLAGSVYSTYDFMDEKRRALTLWETRLLEIVESKSASGKRW